MTAAPATTVFPDAAHRRAAVRSLVWRVPLGTLAFAAVGPLIGMVAFFAAIWAANPVGATAGIAATPLLMIFGTPVAYMVGFVPAAVTGFWVAFLATFTVSKLRLYAGSAAIGAMGTWLYMAAMSMSFGAHGSPSFAWILLSGTGAVSAFVCTYLFRGWLLDTRPFASRAFSNRPFESRQRSRDRLAKARADRLAIERNPPALEG